MKKDLLVTLIISTYNWPQALELVLNSVMHQSKMPHEIIIADDGSTEDTKALIESYYKKTDLTLKHVWQEDMGNRKAKILNKAIAVATGNYIIQIDGDIILHKKFILDHLSSLQEGFFLYGSRSNLKEQHLHQILASKNINYSFFSKEINKKFRTIRLPFFSNFYPTEHKRSSKFRGCNVSFWRSDFIKVNGYDENFEGWGMEDSELIERFINLGLKGKRLKFKAIIYHIYHQEQSRNRVSLNKGLERETILQKKIKTKNGIDKYLTSQ